MSSTDIDEAPEGAIPADITDAERIAFYEQQHALLSDIIFRHFPDEIGKGDPVNGESAVQVAVRLIAELAEMRTDPKKPDPMDILDDLRFDTERELESLHHIILSGRMTGKAFGSYPVEFRGAVISCISIEAMPGDWRPLAMVMPDEKWAEVVPRSHGFAPTKEGDEQIEIG